MQSAHMECDQSGEPTCPLFLLPRDIWDEHLCLFLRSIDIDSLWQCMNKRLCMLVRELTPRRMFVSAFTATNLLLRLYARTTQHASFLPIEGRPMSMKSRAIHVTLVMDQVKTLNICPSDWPNLQSLCLHDAPVSSGERVLALLKSLPPTLTTLTMRRFRGPYDYACRSSLDLAAAARVISSNLPNLVQLSITTQPFGLAVSSVSEHHHWPPHLRTLELWLDLSSVPRASRSSLYEVTLDLPMSLTDLTLETTFVRLTAEIESSALPTKLVRFHAPEFRLNYNSALPRELREIWVSSSEPTFASSPFALPPTLTLVHPRPHADDLLMFAPNIRASAALVSLDAVEVFSPEEAADWIAYETFATNGASLSLIRLARTFSSPKAWGFGDYASIALEDEDMSRRLFARLGKSLKDAHSVENECLVYPILLHCPWLSLLHLTTEEATIKFMMTICGMDGSKLPRLPQLLETLRITITPKSFGAIWYFASSAGSDVRMESVQVVDYSMYVLSPSCDRPLREVLSRLFPRANHLIEQRPSVGIEYCSPGLESVD